MAVFDRSLDELDRDAAQAFGTVQASNQGFIDREAIREQRGSMRARELLFKAGARR